ncbi:thiol reductant ABC exporter subunit CydD [Tessaracoccus sp. MC1679]|nr:thiol reductant ABC exporter subunit CydD [Tessaracoccus sp. MC1679]
MAGPIHPRLFTRARATRGFMVATVLVGLVTAGLLIVQARLLADWITLAFETQALPPGWQTALLLLAAVFLARGLLAWLSSTLAHRSAATVKSQLRRDILAARLDTPVGAASSASLIRIVTQGLDALDGYFSKYLPQLGLAATVPFLVGGAILLADWPSAIIVAFTLPLIPVFMALIGWTTEKATRRSFAVADRLANHFADLIAGLPTLQAFARARAQKRGVELGEEDYRDATMKVLTISFLSSFALELLATLSVAVVAVTVGFRLVYGNVDFPTALFVLILAPEAFLPVRQVGVHFHDSADGVAAADAAFEMIDGGAGHAGTEPAPRGGSLRLEDLTYSYPGAAGRAVEHLSVEVAPGEVVALTGPSGGGKSTSLAMALGFLTPTSGRVTVDGVDLTGVDLASWRGQLAWVGQEPGMLNGTVGDNVALGCPGAAEDDIRRALDEAGADFGPDKPVGDDGEGLSAGERRRVALARALVRIRLGGARLLVLDEPTAGLDAATEARVIEAVRATGAGALIVSHRPAVLVAADRVVSTAGAPIPAGAGPRSNTPLHEEARPRSNTPLHEEARPRSNTPLHEEARPRSNTPLPEEADPPHSTSLPEEAHPRSGEGRLEGSYPATSSPSAPTSLLRDLLAAAPKARTRFLLAILLATLASGSSVALMGVSAWLISFAAMAPPVLYLQPAAVGVRAFGISRGVFRYVERLVGHDVALRLQGALRVRIYAKLSATTLIGRRRGDLLTRVVADVAAIQDLVVRVAIPVASAATVVAATSLMLALLNWESAVALLATALLAGAVLPLWTQQASRAADTAAVPTRGRLANGVRELARTSDDLVAYGAEAPTLARLLAVDEELRGQEWRGAWVRGIATGGQVAAAGIAVLAALWFGTNAVASGDLDPRFLAVLALTPLALHEVLGTFAQAAQTHTRARSALDRLGEVLSEPPVGNGDAVAGDNGEAGLRLTGVAVGWPGAGPVQAGIELSVAPGEQVAVVGPSGVGKTTLAATVMGLIPPLAGEVRRGGRVGYLAQDAHIFATTVAENVRIGNRDATDDDIRAALARAGLPLDPERRIGEAGTTLSGGERRRLAMSRLLVGSPDVVILDEPTEHLDRETATALMDDVWREFADMPLLVLTHDPDLVARCTRVHRLDSAPRAAGVGPEPALVARGSFAPGRPPG